MRKHFHILLISITSLSILAVESGLYDVIASPFAVEMFDLTEEGSSEKDSSENSSEKEYKSDYIINYIVANQRMISKIYHRIFSYDLNKLDHFRDIHLPPPEYA